MIAGMPNPMNLAINPTTMLLEQRVKAGSLAEKWKTFADDNNLKSCEFKVEVDSSDPSAVFYGCLRDALVERGFTIEHLNTCVLGQAPNGQIIRQICFYVNRETVSRIIKA